MLIWADYKFIDSKAELTPVQVVYYKALCVCVMRVCDIDNWAGGVFGAWIAYNIHVGSGVWTSQGRKVSRHLFWRQFSWVFMTKHSLNRVNNTLQALFK